MMCGRDSTAVVDETPSDSCVLIDTKGTESTLF